MVCRKAKPLDVAYQLPDERGLFLFVTTTGYRSWRFQYRYGGRQKRLTFGGYPEVSLLEARDRRDQARMLIRDGIDPNVTRKQKAAARAQACDNSFRTVMLLWHVDRAKTLKPRYAKQILQRFQADIFPVFGSIPIRDVTPSLVLAAIMPIANRGSIDIAHRLRQHISDIFVFAIARGWGEADPAQTVRKALPAVPRGLRPAVTKLGDAQQVLRRSETLNAYAVTKLAGRLLALTAARPGMVRMAAPEEFEGLGGDAPIWRVPAAKMKLSADRRQDPAFEFVLPLSTQAVEVVNTAIEMGGRHAPLVFPSAHHVHKPMGDNTLSKLYREAGFQDEHCPHGWRATFSTIMNERAALYDRAHDRAVIELMLAHIQNGVEPSYNRSLYMGRRRELAQEWADLLMAGLPAAPALLEEQRGTSERQKRRLRHERAVSSIVDRRHVSQPADAHAATGPSA
ncbi:tyrosine-type recombinase/integrase [Sphingomonas oligophenolica]|nr:integrase arm-type DNA-binding domain-containing protein [Sphingomonas oligophenolica]